VSLLAIAGTGTAIALSNWSIFRRKPQDPLRGQGNPIAFDYLLTDKRTSRHFDGHHSQRECHQVYSRKAHARQAHTAPQWTTFAHSRETHDHSRRDVIQIKENINIVNDLTPAHLHRIRPIHMVASNWCLTISGISSCTPGEY
jgi:hypothetical protein